MAVIDRWQRDFPLVERPFAEVGRATGLGETSAIAMFRRLRDTGVLSRIGAVVKPNTVGTSMLAAMRVDEERLDEVSEIVGCEPLVNHSYERTHPINLWFVVAGLDWKSVRATVERIEAKTGISVLQLPLVRAYHIDLGFSLTAGPRLRTGEAPPPASYSPIAIDRALLAAIENGLPLVERPFQQISRQLRVTEREIVNRLKFLIATGVISRFGCVVRHRSIGYTANAMAVWDIANERVDAVAALYARNPQVTLCYQRPRRPPDWTYNLFCMVHARTRSQAYAVIDDLNLVAESGLNKQAVLFSSRCFKQRGASFSDFSQGSADVVH
jgi:DNA-binding Lrp family transcriptional regulator